MIFGYRDDNHQFRIKRKRSRIRSDFGNLIHEQEEWTEITPDGDIISTILNNSFELDGEIISDIDSEIIGKCQEPGCNQYLTDRTFRYCANPNCNLILCHKHARFNSKENSYFCEKCFRSVRWKRFWLGFSRIILWPFVKKVE